MLTPMTRDTLVAACRLFTRDVLGTGRGPDEWTEHLNAVYHDLILVAPLAEKESSGLAIAAGADFVAMPADFLAWTLPTIFIAESEIAPAASRDLPATRGSGVPDEYVIFGRKVLFNAKAQSSTPVLMRYPYLPPPLADAGDIPAIDTEFHLGLAYGAVADAAAIDGNATLAARYDKRWDAVLAAAVAAYTTRKNVMRRRDDRGEM